jgi:hypothetical protein
MLTVVAHFVTEAQAVAVLAEVRPWLRDQPPIDQFREQLEAAVETIWAIHRIVKHYRATDEAFRQLRQSAKRAETAVETMEESAAAPKMANFIRLLKVDEVRPALAAVDRALSRVPRAFSGRQMPRKGPAPRAWYSGFVRDLAEIAHGLGIDVTTCGDWSKNPHDTPFTVLVFAVEPLLPPGEQSDSLAVCAKRIDRAIAASGDEIDQRVARKGKQRKPAFSRLAAAASVSWDPAHGQVIRNFLANSLVSRRYHCARLIPPFSQDFRPSFVGLPPLPGEWGG